MSWKFIETYKVIEIVWPEPSTGVVYRYILEGSSETKDKKILRQKLFHSGAYMGKIQTFQVLNIVPNYRPGKTKNKPHKHMRIKFHAKSDPEVIIY